MTQQPSRTIPRSAVRGTASGVFFMAFFGSLWAYTGSMGLKGSAVPILLIAAITIGLLLIIAGVSLIRSSRNLTNQASITKMQSGKRTLFWFNTVFAMEGSAIFITIFVCNVTHHTELIPIIVALIVGIHFLPLASLFKVKFYYVTGTLLCILAILTWLFLPKMITMGDYQIQTYMSVVGLGSALILWGTGLAVWLMGRRLIGFQ